MRKKNFRYPFFILMLISVVVFWGTTSVMGYKLKLDGSLVKREAETKQETAKEKTKKETAEEKAAKAKAEAEKKKELEKKKKKEFIQVGMEYLDGALFIGDSRTSTLYEYAGWDNTHFFVEYGLTIWDVMDANIATDSAGNTVTVRAALQSQKYDKIYIMLGINELGRGTADTFYEQYKLVIDEIHQLQPDSVIFVQSIMHVTDGKDSEGSYINNTEINARNEKIKNLADDRSIFWLDTNEVFDQEGTGKMNPEYTSDGVHIQAKYISVWSDFLLSHGIETGTPEEADAAQTEENTDETAGEPGENASDDTKTGTPDNEKTDTQ